MSSGGTFRWSRRDPFEAMAEMREGYGDVAFVTWPWEEHPTPVTATSLNRVLVHFDRILKPGSWVFIRCDDDYERIISELSVRNQLNDGMRLVWQKPTYGDARPEPGFIIGGYTNGGTPVHETLESYVAQYHDQDEGPPLQKVIHDLIKRVVIPGDRLLEPFCRAAPGARAAEELDLNYWGGDVSAKNIAEGTLRLREHKYEDD